MAENENATQDVSTNYLEDADISDDVPTLQQLKQRHQQLLMKKKQILENQRPNLIKSIPFVQPVCPTSLGDTVSTADFTTVGIESHIYETVMDDASINATPTVDPNIGTALPNESFDFGSDDSVADPSYVPLSDITNVQPLDSLDVDWFPERNIETEVAGASRTRKRKADRQNWKKIKNQKNRMLGKEYIGYKKINEKYVQNVPKPKRILGPKCNSPFCLQQNPALCANQ